LKKEGVSIDDTKTNAEEKSEYDLKNEFGQFIAHFAALLEEREEPNLENGDDKDLIARILV
jgi:hypothetical protein